MKIKDLEIGKTYYVSDIVLNINTSPKFLLLAKEETQYICKVLDLGKANNRTKGEVFYKDLKSLSIFEDCFFEFKLNPEQLTALRSLTENYDYLYQKWN
jgi:hypothetical protein